MEVRRILEAGAAAQAAVKIDTAGAEELMEVALALEKTVDCDRSEDILDLELRFHRLVLHLCQNPELDRLANSVHALFRTLSASGRASHGHAQVRHTEIAEAISAKDPQRASNAMWRHLSEGIASLADAGG